MTDAKIFNETKKKLKQHFFFSVDVFETNRTRAGAAKKSVSPIFADEKVSEELEKDRTEQLQI